VIRTLSWISVCISGFILMAAIAVTVDPVLAANGPTKPINTENVVCATPEPPLVATPISNNPVPCDVVTPVATVTPDVRVIFVQELPVVGVGPKAANR
jgi:hypothetical protein